MFLFYKHFTSLLYHMIYFSSIFTEKNVAIFHQIVLSKTIGFLKGLGDTNEKKM